MEKKKRNRQERRLVEKTRAQPVASPKSASAKKKANHNRWCAERIFKLFRALLVVALIECVLLYFFQFADYSRYKATPDNTYTVKVENPIITVKQHNHRGQVFVYIESDGEKYSLSWDLYFTRKLGLSVTAFAEQLKTEDSLELVVKNNGFVSVKTQSAVLLDADLYNRFHKWNCTLGLIFMIPAQILFTLISGYYIYTAYFKSDEWKTVKWIKLPKSFY